MVGTQIPTSSGNVIPNTPFPIGNQSTASWQHGLYLHMKILSPLRLRFHYNISNLPKTTFSVVLRKSMDARWLKRTLVAQVRDEDVVAVQLVDKGLVDAPPLWTIVIKYGENTKGGRSETSELLLACAFDDSVSHYNKYYHWY